MIRSHLYAVLWCAVLCAGGCRVKDFKAVAEQYNLGFHLEDTGKGTANMKQALAGKGLSNIVGIVGEWHIRVLSTFAAMTC